MPAYASLLPTLCAMLSALCDFLANHTMTGPFFKCFVISVFTLSIHSSNSSAFLMVADGNETCIAFGSSNFAASNRVIVFELNHGKQIYWGLFI